MRPNFFLDPPHTFNLIDSLPTKLPCTTTDTLTIQDIEPTTNTKYLDLRKKRVKWRCDEIWKLHNIKLNLISTLSLIDAWFHYAYTFSVKIKKTVFTKWNPFHLDLDAKIQFASNHSLSSKNVRSSHRPNETPDNSIPSNILLVTSLSGSK